MGRSAGNQREAEPRDGSAEQRAVLTLQSDSPQQTRHIGAMIGRACEPNDVVALCGPLGAGKTELVKGIAAGLEVPDPERVNSPTFVLVQRYDGRLTIWHVDAYRLSGSGELWDIGFDEMCEAGGLVVVEWADRAAEAIPEDALWLQLHLRAAGSGSARLLETLRRMVDVEGK